jgi:flagellar motor switch protein FliN
MADETDLELDELGTEDNATDVDMVRVGDSTDAPAAPKPEIIIPELPDSPQDLEAVYDVPVQVSAVLGKATMQVNQLLKLGRGAVVELDRKVGEAIDIYVNNRLVARGEVVVVEERLGVTMTEIIKTERN